jgi:cytochrome P450
MSNSLRAPAPTAWPLRGHAPAFRRDPIGFLLGTHRECGDIARLRLGPLVYHFVAAPELVAEVLQGRAANYLRDTRSSRNIALVTGESLLSTEGTPWRRHRRLAQPVFHQRRLAALAGVMADVAAETAQAWDAAARDGRTLDLASEMSRLTFLIVGRCLFGSDLGPRVADVELAFPVLLAELFRRARSAVNLPVWVPTFRHARFHRALADVDAVVAEILVARRKRDEAREDLLGLLLAARDEDGSALTDEEIRNHVITFLLAGHETTAGVLTWAFSLFDRHREAADPMHVELRRRADGPLTWEALAGLEQLDAALHEILRLYPTVWIAERRVVAPDRLGGFAIPAGSTIIVSPFVTHRLELHWPDPEAFQPARFLGRPPRTLAVDGYFPFGAGPHQCIGQHFALLEAKIVLATLCARFRVRLVEGFPPLLAGITLRPAVEVPVRIERR